MHCCPAQATYPEVGRAEPARIPANRNSLPIWSCSVWGLPCPRHYCRGGALLPHLFTLTASLRARRYVFCGTFRRLGLNPASRTLSGTLLCGVRTFLSPCGERPSGPTANSFIIFDDGTETSVARGVGEVGRGKAVGGNHLDFTLSGSENGVIEWQQDDRVPLPLQQRAFRRGLLDLVF